MGVGDRVAASAAENVERAGGPRAALPVWRKLAASAADEGAREHALLRAVFCAFALEDVAVLRELVAQWEPLSGAAPVFTSDPPVARAPSDAPDPADAVFSLAIALTRGGHHELSVALARGAARRTRTGWSFYVYGRCLELAATGRRGVRGGVGAPDTSSATRSEIVRAFGEAAERAATMPSGAWPKAPPERDAPWWSRASLEVAARTRRLAWCARSTAGERDADRRATKANALDEARTLVARPDLPPASLWFVGGELLGAPSRFARAQGIELLDRVASGRDASLASLALARVAGHVDDLGASLTPLELDRVRALFQRPSLASRAARARAIAALIARAAESRAWDDELELDPDLRPLHARARDITGGRFEPIGEVELAPPRGRRAIAATLLDAAVALRDDAPARVSIALDRLSGAAAADERLPPATWALAQRALGSTSALTRSSAANLVAVLLEKGVHPRGPWLELVRILAGGGWSDLAIPAAERACAAKEAGAIELLSLALRRGAWASYGADSARAIRWLARARSLGRA